MSYLNASWAVLTLLANENGGPSVDRRCHRRFFLIASNDLCLKLRLQAINATWINVLHLLLSIETP